MPLHNSHNRGNRGSVLVGILIALILFLLAANALVIWLCVQVGSQPEPVPQPTTVATEPPTEPPTTETTAPPTMPEPEHVVSTATVLSTGDLLMHMPVVNTCLVNGSYNFDSIFRYANEYISAADYAVANLETTLCGTDNGFNYSGYPNFNCPDAIVNGARDAGFDMLLTANNHSYDTTLVGYKRTLEVTRAAGLETLGTYLSADEQKWTIVEVNDIKIGMLCYTYADALGPKGNPRLNLNSEIAEADLCNYFTYKNLPAFYEEVGQYLEEMKAAGAEATMIYLHWGVEYQLSPNENQTTMAQQLCDMGIDVIVGGHPHVVQPMDLLESSLDPEHKTVILYSMGNAVSNQRSHMDSFRNGYSEDGVLFSVTFSKYSDGTVYLEDVDLMPTWVNLNSNNGSREYNIVPLDNSIREEWQEKFNMTENEFNSAQRSYDRTQGLIADGLTKSKDYLSQQKQQREADYLAQAESMMG